ncbi:MAG: hypothetical protein NT013_06420 [Planctomycetia bacterium]|nr:hypothetical protein [Planctomycetia bacterium]
MRNDRPNNKLRSGVRAVAVPVAVVHRNCHGEATRGSLSKQVESLPIKEHSFFTALAMIASLPLPDAKKAEAVRRLMSEQIQSHVRDE